LIKAILCSYIAELISEISFMKNTIIYLLVTILPLPIYVYLGKFGIISSQEFVLLLLMYAFIYRPITDYYRLKQKGLISKEEFWKSFLPGYFQQKYFLRLYTNK
jgi:uncharacterized membrane protein YdjX (TVP38/TMEM64 family)